MTDLSFITNAHPAFIENLYKDFLKDPSAVDEKWGVFFKGFELSKSFEVPSLAEGSRAFNPEKEIAVSKLIQDYIERSHLISDTNPIKTRKDRKARLDLADFSLDKSDLNTSFFAGKSIGMEGATLNEILTKLKNVLCGSIGFEFAQVANKERREWLKKRIFAIKDNDYGISLEKKKRILEKLNGAVNFEKFLHTKYVGQKRFSLEGGETTIPALDGIINKATELGVQEIIIGMAHRGRLNVLANIMGKTYEKIFNEFEGNSVPDLSFGDGDVKYHLGFSSQVPTLNNGVIDLKLVPNPSHLESVNPVVQGFARAKADILYNSDYNKIMPILIHGDAAIAGQGIVYEVIQMSQLDGYYTGGTIHFIINNQIGFTTDWEEARSSTYSTSVADVINAPVFHVNGDDPEAVMFAVELAVEYRQKYNNDVFIDLVCYRKHGHNEADDPKATQPKLYDIINKHENPREIYLKKLLNGGLYEQDMAEQLENVFWEDLQERLKKVKQKPLPYSYQKPEKAWQKLTKRAGEKEMSQIYSTGIPEKEVDKLINHLIEIPEGFTPTRKVDRFIKSKAKLINTGYIDWAMAELMAYGSILNNGHDVRMSGQDVRRGTFAHRHAVFYDKKTFKPLNRLDGIDPNQGEFRIFNSLLSEFGVLGFEYGYSLASPDNLVIWEAQFGDFYNGAQTIIDQYLSAAESKWQRMSGLVMLLPHGLEGQGPEHSSARLERFLQMGAEGNMSIANITTPANFFHIIRRQMVRPFRKPLIIMSPKSLLRHPKCISNISEFKEDKSNYFQEVIDDNIKSKKIIKRVVLCTGKIYYDLLEARINKKIKDVAIIRIEQLYPFPTQKLDTLLTNYKNAELVWVQEEPSNMGAAHHIRIQSGFEKIAVITRKRSASPASGFKKVHTIGQEKIVNLAIDTSKILQLENI